MAIVRTFGKPDLFITMTCNPAWPEITAALLPGQAPQDRPDVVARVFHRKLRNVMDDITRKHVFGRVVAWLMVIEFQKRGKVQDNVDQASLLCVAGPLYNSFDKVWRKVGGRIQSD